VNVYGSILDSSTCYFGPFVGFFCISGKRRNNTSITIITDFQMGMGVGWAMVQEICPQILCEERDFQLVTNTLRCPLNHTSVKFKKGTVPIKYGKETHLPVFTCSFIQVTRIKRERREIHLLIIITFLILSSHI
jgi:hypothetical protein